MAVAAPIELVRMLGAIELQVHLVEELDLSRNRDRGPPLADHERSFGWRRHAPERSRERTQGEDRCCGRREQECNELAYLNVTGV